MISPEDVLRLAQMIELEIPADDLRSVTVRLQAIFEGMHSVESALGARIDAADPTPPLEAVQWPNRADEMKPRTRS